MTGRDESADRGPLDEAVPGSGPREEDLEALRAYEEALNAESRGQVLDEAIGQVADEAIEGETDEQRQQRERLRRLEAERDEYLDSLRRLQAEFDNYRKRVLRQQTELLERGSEGLLERLLPVADALELAVAHAEAVGEDPDEVAAIARIGSLLADVLGKEGLERVGAVGEPFDPTVHDAVAHEPAVAGEPAPDSSEGDGAFDNGTVVVELLRPGYRLKGRVLRPAMVKVRG